jgi:hypothetical protein
MDVSTKQQTKIYVNLFLEFYHPWFGSLELVVSHNNGLAIYIKKYVKAKEELWKLKYFTMQKKYT